MLLNIGQYLLHIFYLKVISAIDQPCFKNANCALGDSITDEGCQLSGQKCGINMEFIPFVLNLPMNICIQYCLCDNESFVTNSEQCSKRNSSVIFNNFGEPKRREKRVKFFFSIKKSCISSIRYWIYNFDRLWAVG